VGSSKHTNTNSSSGSSSSSSRTTRTSPTLCRASASAAVAAPAAADDSDGTPASTSYRFVVVGLIAFALLLCNADRVIMSVAGVPLAQLHGWGPKSLGLVQSSFLWGYMLTPLLGGILADRYGGKAVLGAGILLWSIATIATPYAAMTSLPLLLLTRAVMGLGEGVALPCMNNLTARWVPKAERSRAVAACMGGFQSGSMVGLLAAPAMLAAGGIAGPFVFFGVLGIAWAAVWAFAATAKPAQCDKVGAGELRLITGSAGGGGGGGAGEKTDAGVGVDGAAAVDDDESLRAAMKANITQGGSFADFKSNVNAMAGASGDFGVGVSSKDEKVEVSGGAGSGSNRVPFKLLLSKAPVWACIVANFVNNWGYFILLAWMPLYFKQVVGVNLAQASWMSALPWATMAVSGIFAGTLADSLIAKGWSVTTVRKLTQGVGFIGPAVSLVALTFTSTAAGAVAALTVAIGCTAFTQAGFLVNFQEIGPRYVGALHGMANTAGSAAGILGTYMTGAILESTGSWRAVLFITAGVYAFGAATWLAFSTGERVFD